MLQSYLFQQRNLLIQIDQINFPTIRGEFLLAHGNP